MANEHNVWIFIDETGNSDLQDNYNTIFGLGFLVVYAPEKLSKTLAKMKYLLWQQNPKKEAIEFFHAKDDPKPLRNKVYEFLETNKVDLNIATFDFLYTNKNELSEFKIASDIKNEFLNDGHWLVLSYIFMVRFYLGISNETFFTKKDIFPNKSKINLNIVFSRLFSRKEESSMSEKFADSELSQEFFPKEYYPEVKIQCYFVENKTDYICQMADYFSWSMNRFICRNEKVGFDFIASLNQAFHPPIHNLSEYFRQVTEESFENYIQDNKKSPPM